MRVALFFLGFFSLAAPIANGSESTSLIDSALIDSAHQETSCCRCFYTFLNAIYSCFRGSSAPSEVMLVELVNARLNGEVLTNSTQLKFSGTDSHLLNLQGDTVIRGDEGVLLFLTQGKSETEVLRLTACEKAEMFLDAVFGLKSGVDGVPPPDQRDGSINRLLRYKFDFVLGPRRNGWGGTYGCSKKSNHFSDHANAKGVFPGIGGRMGIAPNRTASQKVTDFFNSHQAQTDYERLRVLLDVLVVVRS
ncbi:hypothetical protein [Candidatus Finniella inopinata]|uniref:Uncharacterized protein n=1 Tax=Candidatus Finniella inopinata TaxID=1696036 RepID=A0A4Q7DIJ9_9PROT|nr:hypothetical protein [Candidatus Finniella inopinata]RZI46180.1 hypothetical protein EQU50_04390 [Candidatus Finniella inopinata]